MAPDSSSPLGPNGGENVIRRAAELDAEDICPRYYHEDRFEDGRTARNQDLPLRIQLLKSSQCCFRSAYLHSGSMFYLIHVLPRGVQYFGQF